MKFFEPTTRVCFSAQAVRSARRRRRRRISGILVDVVDEVDLVDLGRAPFSRGEFLHAGEQQVCMRARPAAGSAPARILLVSTMATPRKMRVPRPPPPMAAPMVATPMAMTVATRRPARIAGVASGSSTARRRWRSVMPMTVAASRTSGSMPVMPMTVLRTIGRRE